jgi:hypothetical protein
MESHSAYNRMTQQVEQTAADLRALVSTRDSKCMNEISAANQRAAAAEAELTCLRSALRAKQSGGCLHHKGAKNCSLCEQLDARVAGLHPFSKLCSASLILSDATCTSSGAPAGALNPLFLSPQCFSLMHYPSSQCCCICRCTMEYVQPGRGATELTG